MVAVASYGFAARYIQIDAVVDATAPIWMCTVWITVRACYYLHKQCIAKSAHDTYDATHSMMLAALLPHVVDIYSEKQRHCRCTQSMVYCFSPLVFIN
jgi:hypothetical protein